MEVKLVNKIKIGGVATEKSYTFFDLDGNQITIGRWFQDDETAIEWFKKGWPAEFRAGAEMYVWGGVPDANPREVNK